MFNGLNLRYFFDGSLSIGIVYVDCVFGGIERDLAVRRCRSNCIVTRFVTQKIFPFTEMTGSARGAGDNIQG